MTARVQDAVAALLPEIERRGDEIAELRRLPPELVEALRAAGAFRIAVPRERGGPELTPREQTEVIEQLSYANPSVGWCVMIGSDSPYWAAFLAPPAAEELFGDPDAVSAGLVQPAGRADATDDGYTISGRWAFGSGCTHADVLIAGCLVFDGDALRVRADGTPDWRVMLAPAGDFDILDTWYTTGLAGSGSNDYTATDLHIPAAHSFSFYDAPTRPEALYAYPGMFVTNMPGVPLGIARRAIDLTRELAVQKTMVPELVLMAELPRVQAAVARAETLLGAARAYVGESLDRLWAEVTAGRPVPDEARQSLILARAHSFRTAREVTQLMADTIGGSSIYRSNPIEGLLRDITTINQHVVAQDRMLELVGASMLTGAPMMPAF